jgi:hypothetical protein
MKQKCISIILSILFFTVVTLCLNKVDSTELFNRLYENPTYKSWAAYWSHTLVDVKFNNLQFDIYRNDEMSFREIDVGKYFSERKVRDFTLKYSPNKNYVFDSYNDKVFSIENDTLKYFGGDVDPSISILCLQDSQYYYHTNGLSSYYDECVWLSDSICVAFGFSWSPSIVEKESGLYIILAFYDLQQETEMIYRSQRFPFLPNQFHLDSFSYLKHKFPIIFKKQF